MKFRKTKNILKRKSNKKEEFSNSKTARGALVEKRLPVKPQMPSDHIHIYVHMYECMFVDTYIFMS